ncbi:MAG: DJ-1/PfpI family protein [Halobacteria archaeon]|nr:DJ-1/PfpI family protein [Halobacteria archaeon]
MTEMTCSITLAIDILIFDGFDELDAIAPYEVFENARDEGANLTTRLCTIESRDEVTASHGLKVVPDAILEGTSTDILVVPGGGWNSRSSEGAYAEAEKGDIPGAISRIHARGATVASVCTGGMLLAAAGITEGRPATTHAGAVDELRESGAEVVDARVVDDGNVVTAGGVTSGIDLALWLVEREFSADIAEKVATEMEYKCSDDVAVYD